MRFHANNTDIRPPAVAGSFYPADAGALRKTVAGLLEGASVGQDIHVRAVIAPHAGYVYSGPVAAEAFAALQAAKDRFSRLVVIGPAHFVSFSGIAVPSVHAFRTPLGDMPLDSAAIAHIADLPQIVIDDEPHAREHALEVELPFLQDLLGSIPIVPLVVGSALARDVATVLEMLWDDKTLVVVSSDLSHYHDYDTARRLDVATAHAIERFDEQEIGLETACGAIALRGMLMVAKRRGLSILRLDLRNSGDTEGDRQRVVGYGAWAIADA